MNLKETYDAIMSLQRELSETLQGKSLSTGIYYREVQVLAAAYELQDYLANRIGREDPIEAAEGTQGAGEGERMRTLALEDFHIVSLAEVERDFESAARLADEKPVLIRRTDGNDLLLFSWGDYISRFGSPRTEAEIAAIEETYRAYQEERRDHP